MNTSIKAAGRLLTASTETRVLEYLLLPYGEPGRTNVGRVTASAGCIEVPEQIVANLEHDPKRPVARSTRLEETDTGIVAAFRIAPTQAGNDLLVEASEGLRTGISVEIDNTVIRDGRIVAGALTGAGFVTTPAFPSAQLVAADAGDLPEELYPDSESTSESEETIVVDGVTYVRKTTSTYKTETTPKDAPNDEADDDTPEENPVPPVTASAPADLHRSTAKAEVSVHDVAKLIASAVEHQNPQMLAALSDIKYDGTGGLTQNITQPAWIGELWSGKSYQRKIVPLFGQAALTGMKIAGWRWATKPGVDSWAGNKAAVPSGTVSTEPYEVAAKRLAGAHDIAREFRDFDVPGFWEGYFKAMTESYARKTDDGVLADVLAAATAVTSGTVPAGAPAGLVKIIDGALSFVDVASPSFALVAPDVWREILLTPTDKTLEYLSSSLGIEDGSLAGFRIIPAAGLATGSVLVGARDAATVYELPGSPIRVEGLDLVKGGIDVGLFGYYGTVIHDDRALALVDAPVGG